MTKGRLVLVPFPFDHRLHRLMTVAASFIARELGELPAQAMRDVEIRLHRLFGLT